MSKLVQLVRRLVALWFLLAGLAGGKATPVPAPVAPAPAAVKVSGPPPPCTPGMGVNADGSHAWLVACVIAAQTRTGCCWPTERAARQALRGFRVAWRKAAA